MAQKEFDLRTHIRDPKTGQVIKSQPYRRVDTKNHGEIYERPIGSNICWFPDGSRAPTLEQVAKINAAAEKAKPRVLTTADLTMIEENALEKGRESLEKDIKAKAELDFQSRMDDLLAERLTAVLPKLGITGKDAEKVEAEILKPKAEALNAPTDPKPWEKNSAPVPTESVGETKGA